MPEHKKPTCIIITGRPGSGKTTLAKLLVEELRLPLISRDGLKEGLLQTLGLSHAALPPETNGRCTTIFFDLVEHYLASQISIVIEAAFQHPVWATNMPRIHSYALPIFLICILDPQLATQRHLERGLADPRRVFFHGDEAVGHYQQTGNKLPPPSYEPPTLAVPTLQVETANGYTPTINQILTYLHTHYANHL